MPSVPELNAAGGAGGRPGGRAGEGSAALIVRELSKSFVGTRALTGFNLAVASGEIHVLVGQNGSGKSTLIKVLSGYHLPDPGGEVLIDGVRLRFGSPEAAYHLGCRFVHQDLGLVASSSVLDNLSYLGGYPSRFGTIRARAAAAQAHEALRRVGLDVDPRRRVATLSAAQQTGVALARAVRADPQHPPRLLVLDEPTAALPPDEVDHLLAMLRRAAASQIAVLLVTHRLDEVFRIGDAVTVLRDGRQVGDFAMRDVDRQTLIGCLVGGVVTEAHRLAVPVESGLRPRLKVQSLQGGTVRDVSFAVRPGQVVGIAGLTGSGREHLLGAVFGSADRSGGTVEIDGHALPAGRPDRAVRAGLALLPADRAASSGVMSLSAADNLTLSDLKPFWRRGTLRRKREAACVRSWFERLQVRPTSGAKRELATFSGGNQQKVLLAKWLHRSPTVMLLEEPTQGVDVGAKAELHRELISLAESGTALVVSSADLEELELLCDRVLIMKGGLVDSELRGMQVTSSKITSCLMAEAAN
ncbi:MAG: sugar ABC transporter ATP-binding protein [Mycobacteriales bacterium]